jgi:hypothetical protein
MWWTVETGFMVDLGGLWWMCSVKLDVMLMLFSYWLCSINRWSVLLPSANGILKLSIQIFGSRNSKSIRSPATVSILPKAGYLFAETPRSAKLYLNREMMILMASKLANFRSSASPNRKMNPSSFNGRIPAKSLGRFFIAVCTRRVLPRRLQRSGHGRPLSTSVALSV